MGSAEPIAPMPTTPLLSICRNADFFAEIVILIRDFWEPEEGSTIEANGTTELEDGLWIGNQSET